MPPVLADPISVLQTCRGTEDTPLGVTRPTRRTSQLRSAGQRDIAGAASSWRGETARGFYLEGSRGWARRPKHCSRASRRSTEIDELRPLIAEGQERGFLTFEQIASCLEEVEVTKEQVIELHAFLEGEGIDIVGSDGKPATTESRRFEPSTAAADEEPDAPRKPEIDLTVEPSLDSLRLYLRSIGKVELLTADREVALAKRIERGDLRRQAGDGRGEPAPRRLHRQGLPGPRPVVPGPDPGGLARASSARSRSSTTAGATSSRRTRRGGSARP